MNEFFEVLIPLERDVVDNAEANEVMILARDEGGYKSELRRTDSDVERRGETPLFLYKFRDVPEGTYRVFVRLGSATSSVLGGLVIRRDGAFVDGNDWRTRLQTR